MADALTEDLVGKTLQGRYRIDTELGEGGMGSVYRAEHLSLCRTVAVKVLRDELADSAEFRARFEREAMVLSGLSHPNIVTVLDYGFEDGLPFLVMEFLEGRDFNDVLAEGRLTVERAGAISRQILRAVGHAHSHGLVHRDLKPQNVMIRTLADGSEHVTVLDFGLAREVSGGATVTKTGLLMGTPAYMSPEQATGDKSDARSDVYSLGIMLYEMFAGQHPFHGVSSHELLRAHLITVPPPLGNFVAVDASVVAVVEKAMAKSASDRFDNANAMLAALDSARIEQDETLAGANAALRAASRELMGTSETRVAKPPDDLTTGGSSGGSGAERAERPPLGMAWRAGAALALLVVVVVVAVAVAVAVASNEGGGEGGGAGASNVPVESPGQVPSAPLPDPTVADPTIANPTVANPTVANPTVANPTVANPTVADPAVPPEPGPARNLWANPGDYQPMLARLRQGNSLRDRQHRVLAVQARRSPRDVRPLLLLAHSYVLSRSLSDGMERYEAALAIDPGVASEHWTREDLITIAAAESLNRRASTLILAHYDAAFAERIAARAADEQGPWRRRLESLAARLRAR